MAEYPDERYLRPTPTVDSQHPRVIAFARRHAGKGGSAAVRAVRLYYAVRDGIRYDPYTIDLSVRGLKASTTLARGRGWCVAKATVLAACCRACGIPARLGFADVRNHLSTARMRELMQTDVFSWHGYTAIRLDGRWVKATPAFNLELCRKFHLLPLEFDGRADSLYHPFDAHGRQHMEYLRQRGEFAEPPIEAIAATFKREYPRVEEALAKADFAADVEAEGVSRLLPRAGR